MCDSAWVLMTYGAPLLQSKFQPRGQLMSITPIAKLGYPGPKRVLWCSVILHVYVTYDSTPLDKGKSKVQSHRCAQKGGGDATPTEICNKKYNEIKLHNQRHGKLYCSDVGTAPKPTRWESLLVQLT
ncbi:hypothetical protein DUNSADRAFT_7989 [Dunaliella salina]|uniref:Encoded protein n=1 Tax=Dunaliella salina TaxID=3046 RepID=A0ABQ7GKD2_DUNSA|nr:hypothetical protein DUNSADRAFT_7989 [Dunaliella salina]|eukprot:KAF5835045.1 hypothetical protein DUNSADRAFT_7989 [Dunaliella salina]